MSSSRNLRMCLVSMLGVVVAVPAGWSSVARADWSAPRVVASAPPLQMGTGYVPAIGGDVAVDSRGDVAVVWSRTGPRPAEYLGRRCSWGPGEPEPKRLGCYPVTTVHLLVVTASGRAVTRVVTSARDEGLVGVVLSPTEAIVLLGYSTPGMIDSQGGLRVAYGPLTGRWSAPRTISGRWHIGWTNGRPLAEPHIALSPDGTVIVAWNGCLTRHACLGVVGEGYAAQRLVVAWHRPGRPFGPPTVVRAAPLASVPQFDAAGTAYLSSKCSGIVATASAHHRRFRRTVVTAGDARSFTLALSGARRGLAAWVAGACSYDETTPPTNGAVLVSLLRAGGFLPPSTLTAAPAESADAFATLTGVTVSWYDGTSHIVQINGSGVPGTVRNEPTARPVSADGGGDILFAPESVTAPLFVRPAGGGEDQPAPSEQPMSTAGSGGRTIALVFLSPDLTQLSLSIWRP